MHNICTVPFKAALSRHGDFGCYNSIGRVILSQKRRMEPVRVMMKVILKEILKEWKLDDCPNQIYHSAWSVNEEFVLKEYSDAITLQRNINMYKILFKAGVPVPEICLTADGKEFCETNDKMYLLTTKLKGKNIANIDQLDEAWFYNFGVILARLHIAFRECEKSMSFWNNSLLEEMNGWVSKNLDQFAPEYLSKEEIRKSICQLSQVYQDLPKQLIHRDVHLGNFLFDDNIFSGYIDFDLSQSNIRIFDVCYFLLGLRLEENNDRVNAEQWYRIVSQVVEGYASFDELTQVERQSITRVMKNIELLFTAYFLGVGDEKLAKSSADLFCFVCEKEEKILEAVMR
jgi:Ser/Thr protein kinase RdoA (MazF antagonist)